MSEPGIYLLICSKTVFLHINMHIMHINNTHIVGFDISIKNSSVFREDSEYLLGVPKKVLHR